MNDLRMIAFKISLAIFMAGSLLDMGVRLNLADAIRGLRDVRFVALTLVWSFVFCPALAYAITLVIPLVVFALLASSRHLVTSPDASRATLAGANR